jgi:hypothetical protein
MALVLNLSLVKADTLIFEPEAPCVAVGENIQISVSGIVNNFRWITGKDNPGTIEGSKKDPIVIYKAPSEAGTYRLRVMGENINGKPKFDGVYIEVVSQAEADQRPECKITSIPKVAIIIHSGKKGADGSVQIEDHIATRFHIRDTLKARFYEDDEIYITSLNLTLEQAFEQAKAKHLSEEPLVVTFIGDGLPDNLVLTSSDDLLSEQTLDGLLDDYQDATGNKVVVIIDAPYSGTLIDVLKGDNRVIVTSTNDTEYNDIGENAFSKFYFDQLRGGTNYWDAWELVANSYANSDEPQFNQQKPQLEDSADGKLAQALILNNFGDLVGSDISCIGLPHNPCKDDGPLVSEPCELCTGRQVRMDSVHIEKIDEQFTDCLTITLSQPASFVSEMDDIRYIETVIKPPHSLDVHLRLSKGEDGKWRNNNYNAFGDLGNYEIRFKIHKTDNTITETKPVTVLVVTPVTLAENTLTMLAVTVPNDSGGKDIYHAKLTRQSDSETHFELAELGVATDTCLVSIVNYNPETGEVYIPLLDDSGVVRSANLKLIDPNPPMRFELKP